MKIWTRIDKNLHVFACAGGKGTVRRKIVRKTKPSAAQDDKKLQGALKKLNVQPIPGVEEVNMFREDGNVLHFTAPKGETTFEPSYMFFFMARHPFGFVLFDFML